MEVLSRVESYSALDASLRSGPQKIHAFEEAGLGIAPFRLVRVEIRKPHPGIPTSDWPYCRFCGTGIVECCVVRDRDGREFMVGNQCVTRTGDAGLIDIAKRELVRLRREAKAVKDAERIAEGQERLKDAAIRAALLAMPHPTPYLAQMGHSLLGYVEYLMLNGGVSGKVRACRWIDKAAALPQLPQPQPNKGV